MSPDELVAAAGDRFRELPPPPPLVPSNESLRKAFLIESREALALLKTLGLEAPNA